MLKIQSSQITTKILTSITMKVMSPFIIPVTVVFVHILMASDCYAAGSIGVGF